MPALICMILGQLGAFCYQDNNIYFAKGLVHQKGWYTRRLIHEKGWYTRRLIHEKGWYTRRLIHKKGWYTRWYSMV